MSMLEVASVSKVYEARRGPLQALLPTSFRVDRGEFVMFRTSANTVRLRCSRYDTLASSIARRRVWRSSAGLALYEFR